MQKSKKVEFQLISNQVQQMKQIQQNPIYNQVKIRTWNAEGHIEIAISFTEKSAN